MNYTIHSFRHAEVILNEPEFKGLFNEMIGSISGISDQDLIQKHQNYGAENIERTPKSLSKAINELLRERFTEYGWRSESSIFQNSDYTGDTWRLDFAKDTISIEVAFNHSTVIAWNLLKPVLASELNHVEKAIQTKIGVLITATNAMKQSGGFDNAVGTYEKFLDYLPPLRNMLTTPLLIIGLEPPDSFHIVHEQYAQRKKIGKVIMN
ncbi:BglII/BstYI family type II restriction endonuclease [Maribacter sp. 2304DJ31-5]|uniref:BglII/BstYI family type II restriction endonuclease n=1 Tax=Maribacter sp. 2304DJ31-5 TaxID=3386273 RepID=UPI0039BC24E8